MNIFYSFGNMAGVIRFDIPEFHTDHCRVITDGGMPYRRFRCTNIPRKFPSGTSRGDNVKPGRRFHVCRGGFPNILRSTASAAGRGRNLTPQQVPAFGIQRNRVLAEQCGKALNMYRYNAGLYIHAVKNSCTAGSLFFCFSSF